MVTLSFLGLMCTVTSLCPVSGPANRAPVRLRPVNLIQHGEITDDKRSADTSVTELTEMVVAEYRKALEERHRLGQVPRIS